MEDLKLENKGDKEIQNIKELAKEAYKLMEDRRTDLAKDKFLELLQKDPNNTYGLVGLGDLSYKLKKYEEALSYYRKCLEVDNSNKFSLMGIMNCYRDLGSLSKVIEVAEEFRHITVTDSSILSRIADAHRKFKNFKESEVYYMQALQLNPKDRYVIVGLGHLYFACQRFNDAIHWWEKLLVIQPNNIKILTEIGNSYRKIKDFDKAISFYEKAEKLDKKNFFALYGLAESYRGKKQFEKSNEYWVKILEFDPNNKLIINRYADCLRGLGEFDKALELFNKILEEGDDYFALLGKGMSFRLMGSQKEAEKIYQNLMKNHPMDPRPVMELSKLYVEMNKKQDAIDLLNDFHRNKPFNEEIKELLNELLDDVLEK